MADRVLLVDDEECIRDIFGSFLKTAGYECQTAASGVEALALLRSGARFDLISSDIMMAPMDGITLLEHVKVEFPAIPVVIASPVADPEVALLARRKGAVDYLRLPCQREEYLAMIRKALETHRGQG
jgi:CheY-like chemotaxis protein